MPKIPSTMPGTEINSVRFMQHVIMLTIPKISDKIPGTLVLVFSIVSPFVFFYPILEVDTPAGS